MNSPAIAKKTGMTRIITVGPEPQLVGGMSNVIQQMLSIDFGARYFVDFFPFTFSPDPTESGAQRIARHLRQRIRLGRFISERPTAIVHFHTCSGFSFHRCSWDMRLARRRGCRTILHMHGAQFDQYVAQAGRVEQRLIRNALHRADYVVALSELWKERLQAIAPQAQIQVIENAVSPAQNYRRQSNGSPCRFLTLARMDVWKGIDDLLDAAAILNRRGIDFRLTLAGPEGSAGNAIQIQSKIEARGLTSRVEFVGPVVGDSKKKLLESSDVYIQPSHHEGMPISILEAFAHSLPVVATCVGAIPEVIEDDVHGLLVPAHDAAALAQAMGTLALDVPRRFTLGHAGLELATTRFSLRRFREDLCALYDLVLRENVSEAGHRRPGISPATA